MPKKKTGQRKKAEKQKMRQKEIRTARDHLDLAKFSCNSVMVMPISVIYKTGIVNLPLPIIVVNVSTEYGVSVL